MDELRLWICTGLLHLTFLVAPKDNDEGLEIVRLINAWAKKSIIRGPYG